MTVQTFFRKIIFLFCSVTIAACSEQSKSSAPNNNEDSVTTNTSVVKPVPNDPFMKNGEEKIKYPNGVLKIMGNYVNGKRDGQWYSWYETGKPWSETFFDKGIKNGATKTWHETGRLRYEGQYANDKEVGIWKYYDEKGNLIRAVNFSKR